MRDRIGAALSRAASVLSQPSLTLLDLSEAKAARLPASESIAASTRLTPPFGTANVITNMLLPRTRVDYEREVGDGLGSSVIMSPIRWVQRNYTQAPLEVVKRDKKNEFQVVDGHPLTQLIQHPNAHYTGTDLWKATAFSYLYNGNGYWIKLRDDVGQTGLPWWQNITGNVKELWYAPHWMIEPRWIPGDGQFISHYNYYLGGGASQAIQILPQNIVHFRNGIDPRNTRKGLSQLASELREIFIDDEASAFVATLLKNSGVPGIVISPDPVGGANAQPIHADIEVINKMLGEKFTGDNRGKPFGSNVPVKIQQYGFNPAQMQLGGLRDISEERVCAAIGIPAAVVGFGTGLSTTKVGATMYEMRREAWEGCVIPMQTDHGQRIDLSLLPEFEANPAGMAVRFNYKSVPALRDNLKELADAWQVLVVAGIATRAQAKQAMSLEVFPGDDVYLLNVNTIEQVPGLPQPVPDPATAPKHIKATEREQRIIAAAPRGQATREQSQLIHEFDRDVRSLEKDFNRELRDFFKRAGNILADAALNVLERSPKSRKAAEDHITEEILSEVELDTLEKELGRIGGAHYLRVAKKTVRTISTVMGMATDIPDTRQAEIVKAGGRRMGLIDLSASIKRRLFKELSDGRADGEGPVELARRIREFVPAGTWSTPQVRAKTIARTETLHAQRKSALESYRDADNVTAALVFDNRTGFDDEECSALDGAEVSLDSAWALMEDEHPNGTRSFAPVIGGGGDE